MHTVPYWLLAERSLQLRTLIYDLWFSQELIYIFSTGAVGGVVQSGSQVRGGYSPFYVTLALLLLLYIVSLHYTPTFAILYCVINS